MAFILCVTVIVVWAICGPIFGFSDTWQLLINTGTTIVTFLMVFLIQNTQNREAVAVQLKLDELIRAIAGAQNRIIDIEEMDDKQLEALHKKYEALAHKDCDDDPDLCDEENVERQRKQIERGIEAVEEELEERRDEAEQPARKEGSVPTRD